jgi:P22 coat protein - gene protein 5
MANTFLTINMITKAAIPLFINSNLFIQNIPRQFDNQFGEEGSMGQIGTTLRIRLPADYTVATGAALQAQDTSEQSVTLAVATQKQVGLTWSSAEQTLQVEDYAERYLMPAMNDLAGAVAADIMSLSEGQIANYQQNVDGANNVLTPTMTTFLNAGAALSDNGAKLDGRKIVNDPWTEARTVSGLAGLFNPTPEVSRQYRTGKMKNALGFDWFMDQTVIKHTAGTFSAGGTVNGAGQTGQTVVVNAITGTLKKGDFVTFAGVNGVNRTTKQDTGALRQFVVTADVANAATSIPVYPAIVPPVGGNPVQYQTVTASPANAAAMALVNNASATFRKSIAYARDAVTMATANLYLPKKVEEAARATYSGISLRILKDYVIGTDQVATRCDILYGSTWPRGEWGAVVADSV